MARKKEELSRIKVYAQHYHSPVHDIKGFNDLMKTEGIRPVKRKTVHKLLGY